MRAWSLPSTLHRCARSASSPFFTRAAAAPTPTPGGRTAAMATTTTTTAAPAGTAAAAATTAPTATPATTTAAAWTPAGATQDEFMLRDQCIVVDEADNIAGAASKLECHRFGKSVGGDGDEAGKSKTGRLHRAFSVFLFDASGRLLLQQRARSKITFPGVWTNTCCSHQLHGQPQGEVDDRALVERDGLAPGAVAAARRKLAHELGVDAAALPPSCFTFVTRLHYCAPDAETHGPDPEWGEHEVDYILLARAPAGVAVGGPGAAGVLGEAAAAAAATTTAAAAATTAAAAAAATTTPSGEEAEKQHAWEVDPASPSPLLIPADPALNRPALAPDADEVAAVRWVRPGELELMMAPSSGLRWSPWFRIIAREWLLPRWWGDLEGALAGKHGDYGRVHRIDC
jgi:isopentenyl-diphosphate delta-isomerase type 1